MTSFQASEPTLCANGCGFFGTAATNNLCSKCFRDLKIKEESAADTKFAFQKSAAGTEKSAAVDTTVDEAATEPTIGGGAVEEKKRMSNRCGCCNKKVGVTGFACRCGVTFCGTHRYPEEHKCSFDYKGSGKEAIAKANPLVKADKIQRF